MWIPTRLYEALPALYVATGVAIMLGALYIGLDYVLMQGYLILGSGCVMAGIMVRTMRSRARSERIKPGA